MTAAKAQSLYDIVASELAERCSILMEDPDYIARSVIAAMAKPMPIETAPKSGTTIVEVIQNDCPELSGCWVRAWFGELAITNGGHKCWRAESTGYPLYPTHWRHALPDGDFQ